MKRQRPDSKSPESTAVLEFTSADLEHVRGGALAAMDLDGVKCGMDPALVLLDENQTAAVLQSQY